MPVPQLAAEADDAAAEQWDDLVQRLVFSTSLSAGVARRIVEEVVAYCTEPAATFIRRRHDELQAQGWSNAEIFPRIAGELATRPVAGPSLSLRQIRRVVYG